MKRAVTVAVALAALLATGTARGEAPAPKPMQDIGVEEKLGRNIPLDLELREAGGERVRLGDYFGDGKPVILVLAYVRCKMLCSMVLQGAAEAVEDMDMVPGDDYRIVTVSIDPRETPPEAANKRRELLEQIGRPGETERWPYLLGEESEVRELADSLGFGYAWDPRTGQYAHPAVIFVLTPEGKISRYLHGFDFPKQKVQPALQAAGQGETGATAKAQSVLSCFRFDPALREYRGKIQRYFRIGAFTVMAILGSSVVFLFVWERKRKRRRGS